MRINIPEYEETREVLLGIRPTRTKVFCILQYLAAARVSELTRNKVGYSKYEPSVRTSQFLLATEQGKKILLIKQLRNLKNRTRKTKNIPINMTLEFELANKVLHYVRRKDGEIFPFTRRWAHYETSPVLEEWLEIPKDMHVLNPLRHIRLSHLATKFRFTDQQLTKYAGWTDSRPAKSYISMRWDNIIPGV